MASEHTTGGSEGAQLGRFLRARRTQTTPDQVGLTVGTGLSRSMDVLAWNPGTAGQRLSVYTAEPGRPDHDALLLLDLTAPRQASSVR